jgi:hypothetical protein
VKGLCEPVTQQLNQAILITMIGYYNYVQEAAECIIHGKQVSNGVLNL